MNRTGDMARLAALMVCVGLLVGGKMIVVNADPPKMVTKQYFVAVLTNDLGTAKRLSAGDPGNQLAAEMMVRVTHTQMVIAKAVVAKFGGGKKDSEKLPLNLLRVGSDPVDNAQQKITGETAIVTVGDNDFPLRQVDGEWRMDINSRINMPAKRPEFVALVRQVLDQWDVVANQISAEIAAGKFKTPHDAYVNARDRMQDAATEKLGEMAVKLRNR